MAYPTYTVADLADFSGRPQLAYMNANYVPMALSQATLLFKIATCLADIPDSPDQQELAKFALLSMADSIYWAQQYQDAVNNPFSSESIGSYSYSKVAKAVSDREKTGIMWFDLAVEQMGVCEDLDNIPFSGGIEVFEYDGAFVDGRMNNANTRFLSPQDIDRSRGFGFDPAPGYPLVPTGGPTQGSGGGDEIVWDDPELPSVPDNWTEDPNNPGFFIAP